jgi:TonB family protein
MSAFNVMSKKSRFRFGVAVVIIIHIGFFIGFWHVKAKRLTAEFVTVDIYSPTAAVGLAMYEALPNEECVKVVNEQAPRPGMPVYVEPPEDSKETDAAKKEAKETTGTKETTQDAAKDTAAETAGTDAKAVAVTPEVKAPPVEVKLEPSLFYASAPRCKGVAATPAGAEKLGAEGFVGLELNINQAGVVERGEINRSSGFEDLDTAALKQVQENLTFKPCQKGTVIVGCKQFIKFRWQTN